VEYISFLKEVANMRISEKAKKTVSRKTFMAVVVSMMVCLLFVTPVFAASSFYSKTTTKLNASYSKKLAQTGGWWSDLVDNNPPSGSIDGNYATSVTVHWVSGISYVNASCTTMTQMTLDYLVPFGIIVG